jgi:hypothetical protein
MVYDIAMDDSIIRVDVYCVHLIYETQLDSLNLSFDKFDIVFLISYGVYISQRIRYSRVCAQYSDFLDKAQLQTQKQLKQGYVDPRLKSPLHKLCGRHHNLFDRYEISISRMTIDILLFT